MPCQAYHAEYALAQCSYLLCTLRMLCFTLHMAAVFDMLPEVQLVCKGAERQRKKKLKSAAVVGVTCCSAGLPVLEGQSFDVCLLDEATQMVEPLTLNPLTTAKPRCAAC